MSEQYVEEPARRTPVFEEADVVVVGGGPAGVAASLSAAKQGARTLLIEREPVLGGTILAGASALNAFTNQYRKHVGVPRKQLVFGIGQELVDWMIDAGGCPGYRRGLSIGDASAPRQVIFLPEIWKKTSFAIMKHYGVKLMMRSFFSDAIVRDGRIQGVIVQNKTGRGAILGKQFIDCSGDADLAYSAGADCIGEMEQEHIKNNTLLFSLTNVDMLKVAEFGVAHRVVKDPLIINREHPNEMVVSLSLNLEGLPATSELAKRLGIRMLHLISYGREAYYVNANRAAPREKGVLHYEEGFEVEMTLRAQIDEIVDAIRRHIDGMQDARVNNTSNYFGVRRTRTVRCEYDITIEDVTEERGFPDEIGRYGYQDLPWKGYEPKFGGSYGIPYRSILPTRIDNLLIAGRHTTSDWTAHMSTRNTVGCIIQGQGAGTAAALCAKENVLPRNVSIEKLQEVLVSGGVYLEREEKP
jgi:hypothetical protein